MFQSQVALMKWEYNVNKLRWIYKKKTANGDHPEPFINFAEWNWLTFKLSQGFLLNKIFVTTNCEQSK